MAIPPAVTSAGIVLTLQSAIVLHDDALARFAFFLLCLAYTLIARHRMIRRVKIQAITAVLRELDCPTDPAACQATLPARAEQQHDRR